MTKPPVRKRFHKRDVLFVQGLDGHYNAVAECNAFKRLFALQLLKDEAHKVCASTPDLKSIFPCEIFNDIYERRQSQSDFLKDRDVRAHLLFGSGETPGEHYLRLQGTPLTNIRDYGLLEHMSDLERQRDDLRDGESQGHLHQHMILFGKMIVFEPATDKGVIAKCYCNALDCEVHVPIKEEQMKEILLGQPRRHIQDIFPTIEKPLREIFLSGITPAEFDMSFSLKLSPKEKYLNLGYAISPDFAPKDSGLRTKTCHSLDTPQSPENDQTLQHEPEHEM